METKKDSKVRTEGEIAAALEGIESITCVLGTYRGVLRADAPDKARARSVVVAWKSPVFRGATFFARRKGGATHDINLASICTIYGVVQPKGGKVAPEALQVAPAAPVAPVSAPASAEVAAPAKAPRKRKAAPVVAAPAPAPAEAAPVTALAPVAAPAAEVPARKRITIEFVSAEEQAREMAPPPADVHADAPIAFYTWGYDGGGTPGMLADIIAARRIALVVDIRRDGVGKRLQGWRPEDLRARFGAAYVRLGERPDFAAQPARVLILRKEEAPGDSDDTLLIARKLGEEGCPVVHLFRDELIDGIELQRAIDADAAIPGSDHSYTAEIVTPAAGASRWGKAVA